jgi:hypothetical protein
VLEKQLDSKITGRYHSIVMMLITLLIAKQMRSGHDWKDSVNHKLFFDEFAKYKNFDPLDPVKWYSVSQKDITSHVSSFIYFVSYSLTI